MPVPRETELEAWELTNKGISLGSLGRYTEERICYHEAIASSSHYAPAWFNLAACLGDLAQIEKSIQAANVALRINPHSVPALVNKGLAFASSNAPRRRGNSSTKPPRSNLTNRWPGTPEA